MQTKATSFPRLALALPPLAAAAVVAILVLANAMGALAGGIHSTGGAILAILLWGSTFIAIIVELVVLPKAAVNFFTDATLQTGPNAFCVAVSAVFLLVAVLWLVLSTIS